MEKSNIQIVKFGDNLVTFEQEIKEGKFKPTDKWKLDKIFEKFPETVTYLEKAIAGAQNMAKDDTILRTLFIYPDKKQSAEGNVVLETIRDIYQNLKQFALGLLGLNNNLDTQEVQSIKYKGFVIEYTGKGEEFGQNVYGIYPENDPEQGYLAILSTMEEAKEYIDKHFASKSANVTIKSSKITPEQLGALYSALAKAYTSPLELTKQFANKLINDYHMTLDEIEKEVLPQLPTLKAIWDRLPKENKVSSVTKLAYGHFSIKRDLQSGMNEDDVAKKITEHYKDITIEQAKQLVKNVKETGYCYWDKVIPKKEANKKH